MTASVPLSQCPQAPEALVDTEHNERTRAELDGMDAAAIEIRLARPARSGLAIGFRGPP
jgi:hypothetical protein